MAVEVAPGWAAYVDAQGNKYYYNISTKVTQWDRPDVAFRPHVDTKQGSVVAAVREPIQGSKQSESDNPFASMVHEESSRPALAGGWENYQKGAAVALSSPLTYNYPPMLRQPQYTGTGHIPCLLEESVSWLLSGPQGLQDNIKYDGTYVDCTFGRGGHSREILGKLSPRARLYAFDVDPDAVEEAKKLEKHDHRFKILHRPFGDIGECFGPGEVNGVLMDLGVSSPQLDDRNRGFNVMDNGPIDLRMNQKVGQPACEWLKTVPVEELAWIIRTYGEDHDPYLAERLAEYIKAGTAGMAHRVSTKALVNWIKNVKGDAGNMHPAKLTFQAMRVFLNQEHQQLEKAMRGAMHVLAEGCRCCIISFKAKEADAVTRFVREHEEPFPCFDGTCGRPLLGDPPASAFSQERLCELFPLLRSDATFAVNQALEPLRVSREEVEKNRRSRSSTLHVLQKEPRRFRVAPEVAAGARIRSEAERFREPDELPPFAGEGNWGTPSTVAETPTASSSAACRVYFNNMTFATTRHDIADLLGEVGAVVDVTLFTDRADRSLGCGTAEFDSPMAAEQAITRLTGRVLNGRQIHLRADLKCLDTDLRVSMERRNDLDSTPSSPRSTATMPPEEEVPALIGVATSSQSAGTESPENHRPPQGRLVEAIDNVQTSSLGYLSMVRGDQFIVLYDGSAGDEAGWSYGYPVRPGAVGAEEERGWFSTGGVRDVP